MTMLEPPGEEEEEEEEEFTFGEGEQQNKSGMRLRIQVLLMRFRSSSFEIIQNYVKLKFSAVMVPISFYLFVSLFIS